MLLKMHFVRQNYSISAEKVLRAYVDVTHYGLPAQMIHNKKGTFVSFRGVKTVISLNYYYREGKTCIWCAIK